MPNVIKLGSTGDDVKRLQRILARSLQIDLDHPITGVFDQALDTAVRGVQQELGVPVDGIVGPVTWGALPAYREASPTLSQGSTGPVVGWLQLTLAGDNLGYIDWTGYTGPIDGIVGDETWFGLLTPGTVQHLTLEQACGLTGSDLPATL